MKSKNTKADESALWQLFSDKSGQYEVRTRHFGDNDKPLFINELVKESSPYLLQHAHNPVNWKPWGEAAFEQAKVENKPIFLSVGYATCHWCHVMEHESFEDVTVADYLNQHYICIKLDREQHPVVDDYYMTALQLIAGQGGWPMSEFLTPDAAPFMAGTYFPRDRFLELTSQIKDLWNDQQEKLIEQGVRVKETVTRYLSGDATDTGQPPSQAFLNQTADKLSSELIAMSDGTNGGFGAAPKFPQEAWLQFLLYQYLDSKDHNVAEVLKLSLKKMQQGGIHDHLAGGFHRYCVDEDWLVPHFEKMLYNQAQLLQLYAQAAVVFNDTTFAQTARQIVAFIKAEMMSEQALFYSALDADSLDVEGQMVEGAYYVWSWDELKSLLSEQELSWLSTHFAVFPDGNFEGNNVLFQRDLAAIDDQFISIQSEIWSKLKPARAKKHRPLTDDKVIVSWNGMVIEALARASVMLNDNDMLTLAELAFIQLCAIHWQEKCLYRVSQSGQVQNIPAVLSDFSNLASAALALRDAYIDDQSQCAKYEQNIRDLLSQIKEKFWHEGVLYQSEIVSHNAAEKVSNKQWHPQVVNAKDGATISATAKLLQILASVEHQWPEADGLIGSWFDKILKGHTKSIEQQNTAHSGLLTASLQRKNHILGQHVLYRSGLKLSYKRSADCWKVTCENQAPWALNDVQMICDEITIKPCDVSKDCVSFEVPLTVVTAELTWQLCDDKQCLPSQKIPLFLV